MLLQKCTENSAGTYHVLKMRWYHLYQNYCITAPYFWTINFGRRNVRLHHRNCLAIILGAVILTGDLSDISSVISGELGPLGEFFSCAVT